LENVIDPNEESTEKTKKIKIWEFEHSTNEQRHFRASITFNLWTNPGAQNKAILL